MIRILSIALVAVLLVGCTEVIKDDQRWGEKPKPKRSEPTLPAAVDDAVDTVVIQKGKIHAGVRAGEKIRKIGAQHLKDVNEVLGE